MNDRELFWEIAFASLLHDIGKFYMRSGALRSEFKDISKKHPAYTILLSEVLSEQISSCRLDANKIILLARHHHETATFGELSVEEIPDRKLLPYALLISEADNISSGERYTDDEFVHASYEKVQYESVFNFISSNSQQNLKRMIIKADRLDKDIEVFYGGSESYTDYASFVGEFNRNAKKIRIPKLNDLELMRWTFFVSLLSLLRFYTSLIPSDVKARKDVSLFDHMKTTSAIATCLYLWHLSNRSFETASIKDKNRKKFLLIAGEIGGIQSFISSIRNVTDEGGVAKRLRARSFKINALSIAVAALLAKQLGLTYASVIYNTGGKFLIVAPNTEETRRKLEAFKKELSEVLVEEFGAILSFNLVWIEAAAIDLVLGDGKSNFADTLKHLESVLNSEKYKPLFNYLADKSGWLESKFVLKGKWEQGEYCAVCESFPGAPNEKGIRVCRLCEEEKLLGGKLLGKSYALITERTGSAFNLFGNLYIELTDKLEFSSGDLIAFNISNDEIEKLLDKKEEFPAGLDLRFSPYYAPTYEKDTVSEGETHPKGTIMTFETLAKLSEGDKSLGVLKADVDRLGFILSSCFPNMSISRLSTFSFLLDYFFSFRFLNVIKKDFGQIYIVYAGGDDLFCLGPWNKVVGMVPRLNQEFLEWVARNPSFSISSAVTILDSRIPFSEASKLVSEELKNAKSQRGTVSIFGLNLTYDDYEEVCKLAEEVSSLLNQKTGSVTISRNTLQKLVEIYKEWEEYISHSKKQSRGPMSLPLFAPHLAYVIYREEAFKSEDRLNRSLKRFLEILRKATRPGEANFYMPKIGVLSTLVLLMTRK